MGDERTVAGSGLPERARKVGALASEHAGYADREGRLAEPVVEALHREGLYGMWVSRSIRGGSELDVVRSIEVIERVSYGDPSAGWVLMAAALAIGTGAAASSRVRGTPLHGRGTRPARSMV